MRIKPEVVNGVDEALAINCHLHFGGSRSLTTRDIITRDTNDLAKHSSHFVKGINTIKQSA
jgi:hypothetical protein